jgi:antitoxin component of RelBE/YafQ-DinJ toxin-antitoxin module
MKPHELKKAITIRLDADTIEYFKNLSDNTGIPYQSLINLYLHDCAATGRKLSVKWVLPGEAKENTRRRRKRWHG